MLSSTHSTGTRSAAYSGVPGNFSLKDLDGFPYLVYLENSERYAELETWYTGSALETARKGKDESGDNFPARVNPIKTAAQKHASALFGEFSDGGESPPVRFRIKPSAGGNNERSEHVEAALRVLFSESNAGPAMVENGLLSQIYGGCVFRLRYDAEDGSLGMNSAETGIRIESIHPSYFVGVPYGSNFWRLREAWVVQQITAEEALSYGVEIPNLYAYYIEHWTPREYQVSINNVLIGYTVADEVMAAGGENRFGFVPFVYIPHLRATGSFYGEPMINDAVKGLIRELNKNIADAGDAVFEDAHQYAIMSGVRGMPAVIEIAEGLRAINLGMGNPTISGGDTKPSLEALRKGVISQPMVDLIKTTGDLINRELYTPSVSYGEFGGGTQRSASSLYSVMWHLTAHAKLERVWWTAGLRTLAKMGLKMMAELGILGITEDDTRMNISVQWAEHLPRDRAELINELSVRAANNIGSLEHLIELSGDVDDTPAEIEKIKEWLRFVASVESSRGDLSAEAKPVVAGAGSGRISGSVRNPPPSNAVGRMDDIHPTTPKGEK